MKKQNIYGFTKWFCKEFGVTQKTLRIRKQDEQYTFIRHCYCAMARSQGFTLTEIADCIERDHSTVIRSIERHTELLTHKKYVETIGKNVLKEVT